MRRIKLAEWSLGGCQVCYACSWGYKITVKDAESTDLSSLLNVLAWMEDAVFAPDKRVDRNLLIQLRSQARNPRTRAPDQKLNEVFWTLLLILPTDLLLILA